MLVVPLIERLLGQTPRPKATVQARLTVNLPSQAGREDWWPVRLIRPERSGSERDAQSKGGTSKSSHSSTTPSLRSGSAQDEYNAEPIFGKSNLIFTLAAADGLLRIPPDATGLGAGELVEVLLV
jgi:molybdopterin molybdotransferase